MDYEIAGITINIKKYTTHYFPFEWKIFQKINSAYSDININFCNHSSTTYGIENYRLGSTGNKCFKYGNEIMFVDDNWENVDILEPSNYTSIEVFIQQVFYTHALYRKMVRMHSSIVDIRKQGILFLGPSGIGKTTQAELWNKYRDARIINGDIVFVQETEECFLGWGTPWHGSSPYCENTSVPVHAMIVLKQAPENSIRELTGFEKVSAVSGSVFYPQWLENGMELCLETLDHFLQAVTVYELSCRPDEDAVALTEKTIFGGC